MFGFLCAETDDEDLHVLEDESVFGDCLDPWSFNDPWFENSVNECNFSLVQTKRNKKKISSSTNTYPPTIAAPIPSTTTPTAQLPQSKNRLIQWRKDLESCSCHHCNEVVVPKEPSTIIDRINDIQKDMISDCLS